LYSIYTIRITVPTSLAPKKPSEQREKVRRTLKNSPPINSEDKVTLDDRLIWVMTVACGAAVANIYYNQPMLAEMARSLHVSVHQIGLVATATQAGYALGMPLFIPLGDFVERRRLLVLMFAGAAGASMIAALASSLTVLVVASLLIGMTSVIAQILIPMAADLAGPARQGNVIGKLLSGLLLGILLARTVSGIVARQMNWRAMFWIAAGLSLTFSLVLAATLPHMPALPKVPYIAFMRSLLQLPLESPELLRIGLVAGMFFASLIVFWTTLVFYLETPPYHYGSQAAGMFGLIGAIGAFVAPWAGKISDGYGSRFVARLAVAVCLIAYVTFGLLGWHVWGLILGVILLDAGAQAAQVDNQSRALSIIPESRNRVNTVYMMCYFGGGTLGSLAGTWAWTAGPWAAVFSKGI